MWEIWANQLLPKALKTCPKSNKSPNLVTLLNCLVSKISAKMNEISCFLHFQMIADDLCIRVWSINLTSLYNPELLLD